MDHLDTTAQSTQLIQKATLHESLEDPSLLSMNFLNEVANLYPDALSFAPGRPNENSFDIENLHRYLRIYCEHLENSCNLDQTAVRRMLFQYGRTKGIIHEHVAEYLMIDEGIHVDPEAIVVTSGCQEAIFLTLRTLRRSDKDIVFAISPTYVGLTGAARLLDMPVWPVNDGPSGVDFDHLKFQLDKARQVGLNPRAIYVVPDFSNPSGLTLSREVRKNLLEFVSKENFLIIEDNAYGLFRSTGERQETLKALDRSQNVIYLSSFAKSCFPGARVGFAVADQKVAGADGNISMFSDELSKIKSMLTVNTSPISQAMIAGFLLDFRGSLLAANKNTIQTYRENLSLVLTGLETRFGANNEISWNIPKGGFFVVLTVPFTVDSKLLEYSAKQHGVLWTPMEHFYEGTGGQNQLRLSVSLLAPEEIDIGLDRLASFLLGQLAKI